MMKELDNFIKVAHSQDTSELRRRLDSLRRLERIRNRLQISIRASEFLGYTENCPCMIERKSNLKKIKTRIICTLDSIEREIRLLRNPPVSYTTSDIMTGDPFRFIQKLQKSS